MLDFFGAGGLFNQFFRFNFFNNFSIHRCFINRRINLHFSILSRKYISQATGHFILQTKLNHKKKMYPDMTCIWDEDEMSKCYYNKK